MAEDRRESVVKAVGVCRGFVKQFGFDHVMYAEGRTYFEKRIKDEYDFGALTRNNNSSNREQADFIRDFDEEFKSAISIYEIAKTNPELARSMMARITEMSKSEDVADQRAAAALATYYLRDDEHDIFPSRGRAMRANNEGLTINGKAATRHEVTLLANDGDFQSKTYPASQYEQANNALENQLDEVELGKAKQELADAEKVRDDAKKVLDGAIADRDAAQGELDMAKQELAALEKTSVDAKKEAEEKTAEADRLQQELEAVKAVEKEVEVHDYSDKDHKHAQERVAAYLKKHPERKAEFEAARARLEAMENEGKIAQDTPTKEGKAQSNADIYLYKAVQAEELYHPDEPIYKLNSRNRLTRQKTGESISQKLAGSPATLISDLADPNKEVSAERIKATETAISERGHATLGVRVKGEKMSFRPGRKNTFKTSTGTVVVEEGISPEEKAQREAQIAKLREEANTATQRGADADGKIPAAKDKVTKAETKLADAQGKVEVAQQQFDEAQGKVDAAQQKVDTIQGRIDQRNGVQPQSTASTTRDTLRAASGNEEVASEEEKQAGATAKIAANSSKTTEEEGTVSVDKSHTL